PSHSRLFLFFITPAPTAPPPLSLHDALPIYPAHALEHGRIRLPDGAVPQQLPQRSVQGADPGREPRQVLRRLRRKAVPDALADADRKSTRLNSSHVEISYAVFCLKKKKTKTK